MARLNYRLRIILFYSSPNNPIGHNVDITTTPTANLAKLPNLLIFFPPFILLPNPISSYMYDSLDVCYALEFLSTLE